MGRSRREAFVVADLGFGDAGKGLVTDALVRRRGAHAVVRFHGGAQAGHNVVAPDGRHHTFSQLGAGTFVPGVITVHAEPMVVHPTALALEARHLAALGVPDALERLHLHARSRVITPYQQAAGRLRELVRGEARHGSCGVGFGETVGDSLDPGEATLRVRDLLDPRRARATLDRIRERKRALVAPWRSALRGVPAAAPELALLDDAHVPERWLAWSVDVLGRAHVDDDAFLGRCLARGGAVVFEGAQGMLLDETHGFHPHTTWSDCRPSAATALLAAHAYDGAVTRLGVLRSYMTRHGEGPLPTETRALDHLPEPHNGDEGPQGPFRRGFLDLVLLRHAARASGGLDALALTHLDALRAASEWPLCVAYSTSPTRSSADLDAETMRRITETKDAVAPVYERLRASEAASLEDALRARITEALELPVALVSRGPSAGDVELVGGG